MKTPTPFCCDINSGSEQERREYIRLYTKALNIKFGFIMNYYGISDTGNDIREDDKNKIPRGIPIIPLSEGIAILKEMVGEETPKEIAFTEEDMIKCFKAGVDFARNMENPSNSEYIMSVIASKLQPKP